MRSFISQGSVAKVVNVTQKKWSSFRLVANTNYWRIFGVEWQSCCINKVYASLVTSIFTLLELEIAEGAFLNILAYLLSAISVRIDEFVIFSDSTIRCHQYKIHKQYCSLNAFKYNFPNHCTEAWNSPPTKVVNTVTLRDFNLKLDDFDFNHFHSSLFNLVLYT